MEKTITAKLLTPTQLKVLDIGAPVIVSCQTLTGETVAVRLQTANLEPDPDIDSATRNKTGKANRGTRRVVGWPMGPMWQ